MEARGTRCAGLPGRDVPGWHRTGLRRRHAAPAHQRIRRTGERRDAVSTPDRPGGHRTRRHGRASVREEGPSQDEGEVQRPPDDARGGPLDRDAAAHVQPRRPADQDRRQVRHRRVRDPGCEGSPALLVVLRWIHPEGPTQRLVRQPRLSADRDGVRA